MANSQGRRAVRAAAHRRRRGGRAAPERVPSGNAGNNAAPLRSKRSLTLPAIINMLWSYKVEFMSGFV